MADEPLPTSIDELQAALRQREAELREAHRQNEALLSVVAHELRNPLAPIHTAVALLERSGAVADQHERWLQVIRRQAHALARLVDELLDVSRLTRGTIELVPARLDLREVIADAIAASSDAIGAGRHTLVLPELPEPLWTDGDADRLEQVLVHLITNAARYTPPGGRIELRAAVSGEVLRLEVEDSGHGLPAGDLERVFAPFTKGDARGGGLGVGLSIVRLVARLHGGDAHARSEGPGKGCTFIVELPAPAAEHAQAV